MTTFGHIPARRWRSGSGDPSIRNSVRLRQQPQSGNFTDKPKSLFGIPDDNLYLAYGLLERDSYLRIDKTAEVPKKSVHPYVWKKIERTSGPSRLTFESYSNLMDLHELPGDRRSSYFGDNKHQAQHLAMTNRPA